MGWLLLVILLFAGIMFICKNKQGAQVDVYRFFKPTCPACVNSQVEWTKLKTGALLKPINFVDVDISVQNNRALADEMGVRTVPHVVAVNDLGQSFVYSGKRLARDYEDWILSLPGR